MPYTQPYNSPPQTPEQQQEQQQEQTRQSRYREKLLALFILGWLMLSFPLLRIWDQSIMIGGWPLLPTAVYGIWLILIAALAYIMEHAPSEEKESSKT